MRPARARFPAVAAALVLAVASPALAAADPGEHPFAPTSPWNARLPADLRYTDSACETSLHDPAWYGWINAGQFSIPVYQASATDQQLAVYQYQNNQFWGTVHVPAAAAPAAGTDKHLVLIEPDGTHSDEMWNATIDRPGGKISVGAYARWDLTGSGIGGSAVSGAGPRAANVSGLAGLLRSSELSAGAIDHALALTVPPVDLAKSWIWPADGEDTGSVEQSYAGNIHMGQLIAIPAGADLSTLGLSPVGLQIATALQRYGAYVVDAGGAVALYADPSLESQIGAARTDMGKIRAAMRCATVPPATDPYTAAVTADHPLAHYRLDDGSGSVAHAVVGPDGAYFGAPTFGQPGALGSDTDPAVALHGADGASLPVAPQRSFALEMWVKTTATAGTDPAQWWTGESLVDGDSSGLAPDYGTSLVAGRPVLHVGDPDTSGEVTIASPASIADGAWHHVVATRDGAIGTLKLYVDGALTASGAGPLKQRIAVDALTLGRVHDLQGDFLHATVDEVAIYNQALSAGAIARHHAAGIRVPPPPPPPAGGGPPPTPAVGGAPSVADAVRRAANDAAKWLRAHGLKGLLARRGWKLTFTAPGAGQLQVRVLQGKRKPGPVAGGARACAAAGACAVTIKATRAGGRLLRRTRSAKLTVQVEFTPKGGSVVAARVPVTVRAR